MSYIGKGRQIAHVDGYTRDQADAKYAILAENNDFVSMPTVGGDPIVESGSNSDGEWTRWADGTQVCSAMLDGSLWGPSDIAIGSGYRSESAFWTYPIPFMDDAASYATAESSSANTFMGVTGSTGDGGVTSRKYRFSSSDFESGVR